MIAAFMDIAAAIWPWLAALAFVGLCAFIRDYRDTSRQIDALLAAADEAERARQAGIQAGFDAGWHGGTAA